MNLLNKIQSKFAFFSTFLFGIFGLVAFISFLINAEYVLAGAAIIGSMIFSGFSYLSYRILNKLGGKQIK